MSPACCLSLSGDTRVSRLSSVSAASSLLSVCHVAALPPSFIAAFSFSPRTCSTRASNSCVVQHVHSFNVTVQMAPPPSTNKNHASFLDATRLYPLNAAIFTLLRRQHKAKQKSSILRDGERRRQDGLDFLSLLLKQTPVLVSV